jgi:hypothetical protein
MTELGTYPGNKDVIRDFGGAVANVGTNFGHGADSPVQQVAATFSDAPAEKMAGTNQLVASMGAPLRAPVPVKDVHGHGAYHHAIEQSQSVAHPVACSHSNKPLNESM